MPYRICKTFEVENGHMLSKHPDKCRFPHGHTRKVELVLEADDLDGNDMVCDFKAVKEAVGEFLEGFDHAMCMNVADPMYAEMKGRYGERIIGFETVDPTTEVLAKVVHDHLQGRLREEGGKTGGRYPMQAGVRVAKVRVWETSSSWAEYEAEGGAMNYATHLQLPDMQKTPDTRGVQIDHVGICDLTYPIVVLDRDNQRQQATATIAVSVSLPHHFKGTHMSRFLEVLAHHQGEITMRTLPVILGELKKRLAAPSARLEVEFTYFLQKKAPVSGLSAPMDYRCTFIGESGEDGEKFELRVKVPVSTLCPCSKVISDYGAHNQRGYVTMSIRPKRDGGGDGWRMVWIEELIEVAEWSASAPIYPLLKRVDERHVTMQAYDNPVFVEDVVRNVASRLREDERIASFEVRAVNLESIHNHSAFAVVTHGAEPAAGRG